MRKEDRHQKRRKAERKAFCILFGIFFVIGGSLLFYITGEGVEEGKQIGDVSFSVEEPLGDKLHGEGSTIHVKPGQRLIIDPTVTIKKQSKPAYIRARILFGGLNAVMRREVEAGISLQYGWVHNSMDGYYYYQYPLEAGDRVCFFDEMTVPENWSEICFCMEVQVEGAEVGCIETLRDERQKISGWTKNF